MDQYHPNSFCDPRSAKHNDKHQELSRRLNTQEVLQAFRYAKQLGLRFEAVSFEKNTTGVRL